MEEKKIILRRIYIVYAATIVFACAVLGRVFFLQFAQGDYWKSIQNDYTTHEQPIEAVRGNIFAVDTSLLATSLPYFEIAIDPFANSFIDDGEFEDSARALAKGLEHVLHTKTSDQFFRQLMNARTSGARYEIIARNVSLDEKDQIKTLPLFRGGQYKGGFIYNQTNHRERPYRMLAERTVGYISADGKIKVGLEAAYDSILTGTSGKRLMRKIAGGVWMPLSNENEIEPQQGRDIVTTINVDIQDVAENALMNSLIAHNAKYGCVVLMEVQTGEIRAIANLTRQDTGTYIEDYNYAIGDAEEPGSTFKLASLLVAMDDNKVTLDQRIDLEAGHHMYYTQPMNDAHAPKENVVTLEEAFWESSNVGISKAVTEAYSSKPKEFTDGLHRLRFGDPLGLPIPGEGKSNIKNADDRKNWSGVSLPWVSIGYESLITPIQTLTLYNAVANNGVMVKPMFVKEVRDKGTVVKTFQPEILNPQIAKPQTIINARHLLEGVVQNGTGKALKNSTYQVAGKTGTAQIAKGNGYGKDKNNVTYQASFVGYFPAEKPKYSCIVIVNAPSGDVYYGGAVAGPIFRQIADLVYATDLDIHKSENILMAQNEMPVVKRGLSVPTFVAAHALNINLKMPANLETEFINAVSGQKEITITASNTEQLLRAGIMPDLTGMAAPDVLYLLENRGYRLKIRGAGAVSKQSIAPGQKINKQTEIVIELSL